MKPTYKKMMKSSPAIKFMKRLNCMLLEEQTQTFCQMVHFRRFGQFVIVHSKENISLQLIK